MLIIPDGRRIGSVSGGCLEGEISKKAWWFTEGGTPVVRVYDTTSDDDAVWEFGLGCNGVVQVMLERVDTPQCRMMLEFLQTHRQSQKPAVVATIIRTGQDSAIAVGDRLFLDQGWARGGSLCGTDLEVSVLTHASAALREEKSRLVHLHDGTDVFVEWVGPAVSLVIFGAGHDAIPLAAMAKELGWHVTVADGRPAYAKPDRFPAADRVVVMPPGDPLRDVRIDSQTVVVMMTHNYPLDARLLPHVLPLRPRYLGMLGPKTRAQKLFTELGLQQPANLHAPVGLDIGCDTPASIALAIVGEIQAFLQGRNGGMLKHRQGSIHAPAREIGTISLQKLDDATRPSYCETTVGNHA
jgi:xanthine/CO dehydrogenase XdhC/CoxF family maturation factor